MLQDTSGYNVPKIAKVNISKPNWLHAETSSYEFCKILNRDHVNRILRNIDFYNSIKSIELPSADLVRKIRQDPAIVNIKNRLFTNAVTNRLIEKGLVTLSTDFETVQKLNSELNISQQLVKAWRHDTSLQNKIEFQENKDCWFVQSKPGGSRVLGDPWLSVADPLCQIQSNFAYENEECGIRPTIVFRRGMAPGPKGAIFSFGGGDSQEKWGMVSDNVAISLSFAQKFITPYDEGFSRGQCSLVIPIDAKDEIYYMNLTCTPDKVNDLLQEWIQDNKWYTRSDILTFAKELEQCDPELGSKLMTAIKDAEKTRDKTTYGKWERNIDNWEKNIERD